MGKLIRAVIYKFSMYHPHNFQVRRALPSWIILITFFVTFVNYFCFAGELRFCYNGPQRIQYKDCPGGFIAKKTLTSTCMYYYKQEGSPNIQAKLSDNICESFKLRELDEEYQDFTDDLDFQSIRFISKDNGEQIPAGRPDPDKCNETCLPEWIEPKYFEPVPIFVDKVPLDDTEVEKAKAEYVELTKQILIKIINEDEFEEDMEDLNDEDKVKRLDVLGENITGAPMSGLMKLLAKSMRITQKICGSFVESSFYKLVFRTMQEFRRINHNFPNMNNVPLKRIMAILDKCEEADNANFKIEGRECEEKFVVQTITDLKKNRTRSYKMQPDSFRWGRYDPIIESAWNAVNVVHAYCFDHFITDMLHYSLYVKVMIEIFVQPIVEKHWMNPSQVGKGMTIWDMAYDTSDILNQLRSLDACVMGAYSSSVYESRLERPFATEEQLAEPQLVEDTDLPKDKGWKKSIDEYWKQYDRRYLREVIDEIGYCAKTPEEFAEMEKMVKEDIKCEEEPIYNDPIPDPAASDDGVPADDDGTIGK